MAEFNESSHVKNINAFREVMLCGLACGKNYRPSRAALKLSALTSQLAAAQVALQEMRDAQKGLTKAINARKIAFKQIPSLAAKVLNALQNSQVASQTMAETRSHVQQINIYNSKSSDKPEGKPDTTYKTNRIVIQNHPKIIDQLAQLIHTVTKEPNYLPQEIELKVIILNMVLHEIRSKHSAVIFAQATLSHARMACEKCVHATRVGLIDTGEEVKEYLTSTARASASITKKLNAIKFIRLSEKKRRMVIK
ncbi:MAG: hypothetical protein HOP30_21805 [Cyclobacteriaceae bacterium]|nr:hypothetical protein [Cyclobacteriaceae bacterium]